MDLATMRTHWRQLLGDRAASISTGDIDASMNRIWQFSLVDLLPIFTGDHRLAFSLTASTAEYDLRTYTGLKGRVKSIHQGFIGSDFDDLVIYTRPELFWVDYDRSDLSEDQPQAMLITDSELIFRAVPDSTYSVELWGRFYRAVLTNDGLPNNDEAYAVIRGGALDYATRQHYDDVVALVSQLWDASLRQLRKNALAQTRGKAHRSHF